MITVPYILLNALIAVESGGRDHARGRAGELGALQISTVVREDVSRLIGRRITAKDCLDRTLACKVALVYLNHYVTKERLGRTPTLRDYAMVWHWGPNGWKRRGRDEYWDRVNNLLSGPRSDCCKALIRVAGRGDGSHWYECTQCGKPCTGQ